MRRLTAPPDVPARTVGQLHRHRSRGSRQFPPPRLIEWMIESFARRPKCVAEFGHPFGHNADGVTVRLGAAVTAVPPKPPRSGRRPGVREFDRLAWVAAA